MENEVDFAYRDLIKSPLSAQEIIQLAHLADLNITELVNTRSQVFKKMGMSLPDLRDQETIEMMMKNPRIIIRPILTGHKGVLLRFDQEQYLKYISNKESDLS